jgi:hypothetical protein
MPDEKPVAEHIGFRCPPDLVALIKEQMVTTGKGKTDIIVGLMRLGAESDLSKLRDDYIKRDEFERRLGELEGKLLA